MGRFPKRKTKEFTDTDISDALKKLKEGMSFRKVAEMTGIPKSSLQLYKIRKNANPNRKRLTNPKGRKPSLFKKEESNIVTTIITLADLGWPTDQMDVAMIIGNYCKDMNRETQFKNNMPGTDYMKAFFKKHESRLTRRRAKPLKVSRAKAGNPEIINIFFDIINDAYKRANIDVTNPNHRRRVFNPDETGFKTSTHTKSYILPIGRPANVLAACEGKTNYSVLMCGNAAGEFIPPYIIYKGAETSLPIGWCMNGPIDAAYNTSPSGWMDQDRFLAWLKWFDRLVILRKIEKPVVLMDGASCHKSLSIVEEALKCDIILVKLPPNSTHFLQALDVGVFGPCKKYWVDIIRKFYRQSNNGTISKSAFPALLAKLFQDMVEKPQNLINGFRSTGVWPIDKQLILDKVEKRGLYKTVIQELPTQSDDQPSSTKSNQEENAENDIQEVPDQHPDHHPSTSSTRTFAERIQDTDIQEVEERVHSEASLVRAIRSVMNPPKDSTTINALANSKRREKIYKESGEILTSDEVVKALKIKEAAKNKPKKKTTKTKTATKSKEKEVIKKTMKTRMSKTKNNDVSEAHTEASDNINNTSGIQTICTKMMIRLRKNLKGFGKVSLHLKMRLILLANGMPVFTKAKEDANH